MNSLQRKSPGAAATASEASYHSSPLQPNISASPAENLLHRLDGVRSTGRGQWLAKCPAHDDGRPSLSIRELPNGKLLLHCFAACEVGDVLATLGLELGALFPDSGRDPSRPVSPGRRWDYRALLQSLRFESTALICIANDCAQGREITSIDMERAHRAAIRIARVAEVAK